MASWSLGDTGGTKLKIIKRELFHFLHGTGATPLIGSAQFTLSQGRKMGIRVNLNGHLFRPIFTAAAHPGCLVAKRWFRNELHSHDDASPDKLQSTSRQSALIRLRSALLQSWMFYGQFTNVYFKLPGTLVLLDYQNKYWSGTRFKQASQLNFTFTAIAILKL